MTTQTIEDALRLLHEPGDVFEIRILNTARAGTVSGYFSDAGAAATAIARWDGKAPGVYVTLNPVAPELLARASNRLKERVRDTTKDGDVVRRRWLLVDVDFHRPAGISASDVEVEAARAVAWRIKLHLEDERGWPMGIFSNSGNGFHLLYRIDLPNDAESRDLVKSVLVALAARFDDPSGVTVDTTVHNAARISKVPGTMACKGDDTFDRPHRRSHFIEIPEEIDVVSTDALVSAAGSAAKPSAPSSTSSGNGNGKFSVEDFMQRHGLHVRRHKSDSSGDIWELEACPFNAEHVKGEAFVSRSPGGALLAGCHHNGCTWRWDDLREQLEPGYREKREQWERGRIAAIAPRDTPERPAGQAIPPPEEETLCLSANAPPKSTLSYVNWPVFWDTKHNEEEWLFRDVIATGRAHVIYAKHGVGKSLFTAYMCAKMATEGDAVVQYLDFEMTESDLFERLSDMGYGPGTDLSRLHYALLPSLPPLDTAAGGKLLLESVDALRSTYPSRPIVTVVDTMSRAVSGEDDKADTIRAFYRHCGLGLKQRGVTWSRLDHEGKDKVQGQRGTSAKGDDVDIVWQLERMQNGVRLHRKKSRMGWVPETVQFGEFYGPLRFIPVVEDWPAGTATLANILDRLDVPLDASTRAAQTSLRTADEGRRNDLIVAAMKWRRERYEEGGKHPGKHSGKRGKHSDECIQESLSEAPGSSDDLRLEALREAPEALMFGNPSEETPPLKGGSLQPLPEAEEPS